MRDNFSAQVTVRGDVGRSAVAGARDAVQRLERRTNGTLVDARIVVSVYGNPRMERTRAHVQVAARTTTVRASATARSASQAIDDATRLVERLLRQDVERDTDRRRRAA